MAKESDKRKKDKNKRQSILEAEVLAFMQKSIKAALDAALDDILKDFH